MLNKKLYISLIILFCLQSCNKIKEIINYKQDNVIEGKREEIYSTLQHVVTNNKVILSKKISSNYYDISDNNTNDVNFSSFMESLQNKYKTYRISEKFNYLAVSDPVIIKDIIYLIDGKGVITARNINTPNELLWSYLTNNVNNKTKAIFGANIATDKNYLYVATGINKVLKIDLNGKKVWEQSVSNSIFTKPLIYKNYLYCLTIDNKLYALDKNTGEVIWGYETISTPAIINKQASPIMYEDKLIVPFTSSELNVFSHDGKLLWERNLADESLQNLLSDICNIEITPIVSNDIIYVTSNIGVLKAINIDGKVIWENIVDAVSAMLIYDNYLFTVSKTGWISVTDKSNGKIILQYRLLSQDDAEKVVMNKLFIADNKLFAFVNNGQTLKIDLDNHNILKVSNDKQCNSSISFYKNKILILDSNGELQIR